MIRWKIHCGIISIALLSFGGSCLAQEMPREYQQVLTTLGKKGDYKDNVLKVNVPRNDLKITVDGVQTPTAFGFGGWVAMTKGDHDVNVMMGDLVLLQDEVNPVMSALLNNGLEVTALHNHFFWEQPRIFYMHVHGHGSPSELAGKVKPALELIGHVAPAGTAEQAPLAAPTGRTSDEANTATARPMPATRHATIPGSLIAPPPNRGVRAESRSG